MEKWIGNLDPRVLALPRRPQFIVVLKNVLVATVHRELVRTASPADRHFETLIGRDHVVGQNSAITPTADAEFVRIGNSFGNGPIDASLQIGYFFISPIGKNAASEFSAASVAAAIVDRQDDITLCGKNLPFDLQWVSAKGQAMIVLPIRAAMNP